MCKIHLHYYCCLNRTTNMEGRFIFRGLNAEGITAGGLVHKPLCGLLTDGHSVRPGPWVNIICISNHSLSRSRSACSHLFHSCSKSRCYILFVCVKCQIHKYSFFFVFFYNALTEKIKSPQVALWFSSLPS